MKFKEMLTQKEIIRLIITSLAIPLLYFSFFIHDGDPIFVPLVYASMVVLAIFNYIAFQKISSRKSTFFASLIGTICGAALIFFSTNVNLSSNVLDNFNKWGEIISLSVLICFLAMIFFAVLLSYKLGESKNKNLLWRISHYLGFFGFQIVAIYVLQIIAFILSGGIFG